MNRRAFLSALSGSLLAAPLAVEAQSAGKVPQLCFLTFDPGTASQTEALTITVGNGVQLHANAEIPGPFNFWPDSGIGIVSNGDGTYKFIAASGGSGDIGFGQGQMGMGEGTLDDFFSVTSREALRTVTTLNPDGSSTTQWKGGGPIYKDPASGLLIMPWHNEQDLGSGSYWSYLSMARSLDAGETWQECGPIIAPHHTFAEMAAAMVAHGYGGPNYLANDGWGQFLIIDGYMYIYYNNCDTNDDGSTRAIAASGLQGHGICVARSLLADVVAAATTGTVAPWYKYKSGTWTEPGLYGIGVPVIMDDVANVAFAFNSYRNRYILMGIDEEHDGPMTFWYKESLDGLNWSATIAVPALEGNAIARNTNPYKYWTMVNPTGDPMILGQSFYLIGHEYADDSIWRFPITLNTSTTEVQPQDGQSPRSRDPAVAPSTGGSGARVMDRRAFPGLTRAIQAGERRRHT